MGTLINEITSHYDPRFKTTLEARLLIVAPQLSEAEGLMVKFLMTDQAFPEGGLNFKQALRQILAAVDAVPEFSVESEGLDEDGNTLGDVRSEALWTKEQIISDRFGYLGLLKEKIS